MKRKKQEIQIPLDYSLPKALLDILYDLGEHAPFGSFRKNLYRKAYGIPEPPWWRYNRAMQYLKQQGQITIIKKNEELFIKLTKKGKLRVLLNRLNHKSIPASKWDGKWRIIIWDIPESSSTQRNVMRRIVKTLGYYQLQQSVFITPYPIPADAVNYLNASGLARYIRFLRVDKIDDEKPLVKHFNVSN